MKFYSATKTISVGIDAKPIFETLDRIRPNDISFSLMVAIAAEEYIKIPNYISVILNSFKYTSPCLSSTLIFDDTPL